MSDMEQSDVATDAEAPENVVEAVADANDAPVAEPVAPEQPEAPTEPVEEPSPAAVTGEAPEAEPTLEPTPETPPNPQPDPWPVPVVARTPSGESVTQQPEAALKANEAPLSLADAARVLLIYVKAHRTAGDSDLEAAVADVEAALAQA